MTEDLWASTSRASSTCLPMKRRRINIPGATKNKHAGHNTLGLKFGKPSLVGARWAVMEQTCSTMEPQSRIRTSPGERGTTGHICQGSKRILIVTLENSGHGQNGTGSLLRSSTWSRTFTTSPTR